MEVNLIEVTRHFASLSDETLHNTRREDLTADAQICFDEELARRGLGPAVADTADGLPPRRGVSEDRNDAKGDVLIASFNLLEEARFAYGLLESAAIPARIENENPLGLGGLRLLVPAEFETAALEVLETPISDEELAAQSEASIYEQESAGGAEPGPESDADARD